MIKKILAIFIILIIGVSVFAYNKLTIFTIQPIGALPEGITLVIWQRGDMNFFESADGLCLRKVGGVSLMCRMSFLGGVTDKDNILIKLPFSEYAYLKSTGGRNFDR